MRYLIFILLSTLIACHPSPPAPAKRCLADSNWITNPTMPSEVPSKESFCDFCQFSWQWFLAQVSPSGPNGELALSKSSIRA